MDDIRKKYYFSENLINNLKNYLDVNKIISTFDTLNKAAYLLNSAIDQKSALLISKIS